jgi:hypothetical protein
MPRGGYRKGSGRQVGTGLKTKVRAEMDKAISPKEWVTIWKKVKGMAMDGDLEAFKVMLNYYYGRPAQILEVKDSEGKGVITEHKVVYKKMA